MWSGDFVFPVSVLAKGRRGPLRSIPELSLATLMADGWWFVSLWFGQARHRAAWGTNFPTLDRIEFLVEE